MYQTAWIRRFYYTQILGALYLMPACQFCRLSGRSGLPTSSSWYVTWNLAGAKIRVLRISVNSRVVCSLLYFSV